MMRVLLDSDVVLDLILSREPHFANAYEIFNAIARKEFQPFVAAISVLNVNYFAEKEKDRAFALIEVEKLLSLVFVCSTTEAMLKSALTSPVTDYEDAVQCASAMAENLDGLVTRNKKDFENSPIQVYSPAEFLATLAKIVE